MAGLARIDNIEMLIGRVLAANTPGDFVETGTMQFVAGSCLLLRCPFVSVVMCCHTIVSLSGVIGHDIAVRWMFATPIRCLAGRSVHCCASSPESTWHHRQKGEQRGMGYVLSPATNMCMETKS
jgi:Macrocin-O-methyltransferase (TylF)